MHSLLKPTHRPDNWPWGHQTSPAVWWFGRDGLPWKLTVCQARHLREMIQIWTKALKCNIFHNQTQCLPSPDGHIDAQNHWTCRLWSCSPLVFGSKEVWVLFFSMWPPMAIHLNMNPANGDWRKLIYEDKRSLSSKGSAGSPWLLMGLPLSSYAAAWQALPTY